MDLFAGLSHVEDNGPDDEPQGLPVYDELALPLLPHQREGVEACLAFGRAMLCDEMGVGKTPTGISITCSVVEAGTNGKPVVWVVPPSLRTNTVREFARFAPHLSVEVVNGRKPTCVPQADVIVCGDSTIGEWAPALVEAGVAALVVDEAHRAKNHKAKRTQGIRAIAQVVPQDPGVVLLMTGTPLLNHPAELVSPLTILSLIGKFGGPVNFLNRYCPVVNSRFGARGIDHALLPDLHIRLSDLTMIRRLKADVLDLPNKGRMAVALDCDSKVEREYALCESDLRAFLVECRGYDNKRLAMVDRAEALVRLGQLRRLAGRAVIGSVTDYVRQLQERQLPGEPLEKVVIFCEHRDVAEALTENLDAVQVVGGMGDKAKQQAVDAFMTDPSTMTLVANSVAGGVGITLTSARHVVMAELPWTPAALQQAEDRCHRISQEREVVSHIVLPEMSSGIESITTRVWALLEAKHNVAAEVVDGLVGEVLMDEDVASALIDIYSS